MELAMGRLPRRDAGARVVEEAGDVDGAVGIALRDPPQQLQHGERVVDVGLEEDQLDLFWPRRLK